METREKVRQVVLKAMRSQLVTFSEGSIADDAVDRIMEIFKPFIEPTPWIESWRFSNPSSSRNRKHNSTAISDNVAETDEALDQVREKLDGAAEANDERQY